MVEIPQLPALTLAEWQSFLDYLSACLCDCAQLYITEIQFKASVVGKAYLRQFREDIVCVVCGMANRLY
jgi:hypothetical protein